MSSKNAPDVKTLRQNYIVKLDYSVKEFLKEMESNIVRGSAGERHVALQLDILREKEKVNLLANYKLDAQQDVSLLQLAAFFHVPKNLPKDDGSVAKLSKSVVVQMAEMCPQLIWSSHREGQFEGQTVLHTIVSKQDVEATKAILDLCKRDKKDPDRKRHLLESRATGSAFRATIMLGELPLSIAALTFNKKMVRLLLRKGARIYTRTSRGDTVFHTLVRFAYYHPDKVDSVKNMMNYLHDLLPTKLGRWPSSLVEADQRDVWLMENDERLTALRLSATLAQPELFKMILSLKGVYVHLNVKDGPFDSLLCDITEIDPVASYKRHASYSARSKVSPDTQRADGMSSAAAEPANVGCCPGIDTPSPSATSGAKKIQAELRRGEVSILEIICETGRIEKAFGLLNTYVVKGIIREKWSHYRLWFILWFIAHVILMVFFTTYAVYKARLIRYHELQQLNATEPPSASAAEEAFVFAGAILAIPVALLLLLWEVVRVLNRQPLNLWLIHHNGVYRSILVIFALSVLTDSIWYFAKMPVPDNNYFLILALLVGWWFMTFFLRPFRKFSFFTVMLQKVLVGDMFRFSTVILLELLAFSVAMHMTYLPTPGPLPEDFEHLGITLLTMFKLMLGLTEVEILNDAPHPWLADLLYVMFTLLTYLLMLNALIAMMSNTCSIVAENRNSQFELQRLSVVLMLESMVPFKMRHCCGEKEKVAKYDVDNRRHMQPEKRFFKMVTSVQRDNGSPDAEPQPDSTPTDGDDHMSKDVSETLALMTAYAHNQFRLDGTIDNDHTGRNTPNGPGTSIRGHSYRDQLQVSPEITYIVAPAGFQLQEETTPSRLTCE
ncbi:hypothetical protein BaRGS_00038304 [Batillaria attramentaria]|uniref:Uncharacterized protein n=1 Tax=Batillaria attramentaria TaxID=370345 RepID=A0ABD0J744_9CAEN